jgi:DNA-binding NtrC family response regulator
MKEKRVLVVDDERNIRLTVSQALEPLQVVCEEAVNGEDALDKMKRQDYELIILDLKMPGVDGMEVLRRLRQHGGTARVLIITAHGTIDKAVEAMKLGAVDFLQKPFTPDQLRQAASQALRRGPGFLRRLRPVPAEERERFREVIADEDIRRIKEETGSREQKDYEFSLEQAKAAAEARDLHSALAWAQKAVAVDPARPEAFNLLGVVHEVRYERLQAQKYYRAALALDPTFKPAQSNLHWSTQVSGSGALDLGGQKERSAKRGR